MYNDQIQRERRRGLRENQTEAEILLWERIRDRKLNGLKFRRQYGVGPYILDFFCSDKRIAIELDGEQHKNNQEYDTERDLYLNDKDIKVLRFWNEELIRDIEGILKRVEESVKVKKR